MAEKKKKIMASRERLDLALASKGLSSEESVKLLVKTQLLRSPFSGTEDELMSVVNNRSEEVFNFLDMLRSASIKADSHSDWKIKQDTEQFRVMYREGLHGSPFHTLLAEGFADGPIDVCLCVSWETTLYKKWWPQFNVPPFKIITSTSLNRVRVGDEISLMRFFFLFLIKSFYLWGLLIYFMINYLEERMKVPWPLTDREVVLHYFEIEYPEEDLVFVLIKTIPDEEHVEFRTHGFSRDGIPLAGGAVRMDVIGGFAIQRISPSRCYFRSIANMDIKIDFVPPSLINFVSRQLIGDGYKLYQKVVSSVAASDDDYVKALKGQLYSSLCREEAEASPYQDKKLVNGMTPEIEDVINGERFSPSPEQDKKWINGKTPEIVDVVYGVRESSSPDQDKKMVNDRIPEIVDVAYGERESPSSDQDKKLTSGGIQEIEDVIHEEREPDLQEPDKKLNSRGNRISPEVDEALKMMDQVITAFRELKKKQISQSIPALEVVKDAPSEERHIQVPAILEDKHDLQLNGYRHEGNEDEGRKNKKVRRFFLLSCFKSG